MTRSGGAVTQRELRYSAAVLQHRIDDERAQLAHTVEELVARMDVKARMRHRSARMRERARLRWRRRAQSARRSGRQAAERVSALAHETTVSVSEAAQRLRTQPRPARRRRPRSIVPEDFAGRELQPARPIADRTTRDPREDAHPARWMR